MANDRIIIRCKFCGEHVTLAKYYPTLTRYGRDVSEWVTKHLNVCMLECPMDFDTCSVGTPFELLSETELYGRAENLQPPGDPGRKAPLG